jgi:hypothetical protein
VKNKVLLTLGLLFFGCADGSESEFDTESISSKSTESEGETPGLSPKEGHSSGGSSSSSSSSSGDSSDDSSSESSESDDSDDSGVGQDKIIDKTWGLKNLLSSTPDKDLYRSPLLGLIAVNSGTIKKWYGAFTDIPAEQQDAGRPIRNKRIFTSETSLEKVTRSFFDILDNRARCSVAGSSPLIALSAEGIAQLVILTHERGISGTVAFLEKGLVGKRDEKKSKRGQSGEVLSVDPTPEELFINQWWERYGKRAEKGKYSSLRDFRKALLGLCGDLSGLQKVEGPEKTKELFLTILMAFLVLKDETEGQKNQEYAIQDYFKKLGSEYVREYYTTLEKKAIQKRSDKRSFGTSVKDFEEAVFCLVALAKNDFEFINAPATSAFFKETIRGEEREVSHPLCAESAVRSFTNLMLYNPVTQLFDAKMLPEGIHLDPWVYDFYFNSEHPRTDPQVPRYYAESADAWIQVIVRLSQKFPEIKYDRHELRSSPEGILLVFNKIFGTTAQSYQELGNVLSKDGSQITIEKSESKEESHKMHWTVAVERDGVLGEDPYTFFATLETSNGHAALVFDMENIIPLMGKHQYRSIQELQKFYHVDLWPMVLNAAAINAVIDGETPFQKAIETGCIPLVELLIAHGADIYQEDDEGMGVLAYAYESESAEMVKFFTNKGFELHADVETIRAWLWTTEVMGDALFDKIMASNVTDSGQQKKDFYSTALMICLERNWVERAKSLIKEGADINFIEVPDEPELGLNAPLCAAARGCTDEAFINSLVDALEPAGDDKNRAQVYAKAIEMLISKKYMQAVTGLIGKGADTNFYGEYPNSDPTLPPLVHGVVLDVSRGEDKQLMVMVVDKLNPAGENKLLARLYGNALHSVLGKKWFDIAKTLIEKGADTNFYSSYESEGVTGVYGVVLSASYGDDKELMETVVDRLVPAGENRVLARLYGNALYHVISKQWFDLAKILIQKGADVNFYDNYYGAADVYGVVLSASSSDDKELMRMVVQKLSPAGTNEVVARIYGKALSTLLYKNWFDIVEQLVEKGALLDEINANQLENIIGRSGHHSDQSADHLLQVMGRAKKSDAWAQMYKKTVRNHASLFKKTEEWLKQCGASLKEEAQEVGLAVEDTIKDNALKLEEVFGEEYQMTAEPGALVYSEKIPELRERSSKVLP